MAGLHHVTKISWLRGVACRQATMSAKTMLANVSNGMARPCSAVYLLSRVGRRKSKAQGACDAHISDISETISTIGVDVGKNKFHLWGSTKVNCRKLGHRLALPNRDGQGGVYMRAKSSRAPNQPTCPSSKHLNTSW
jgi:hypothetical protein